jgi:hypothetical protein
MIEKKIPFVTLSSKEWQNLGLLALAIFYTATIALDLVWENMCSQLGVDYCCFWSAAEIANENGYRDMYNLSALEEIQRSIFPQRYFSDGIFRTVPMPYLPVFILPFQALSLWKPNVGFLIWTIVNLVVIIFYLRFFIVKTLGCSLNKRLLVMVLFSLPVFLNFYHGQVNLLLTISLGEYLRASMQEKPIQAGAWLGGLLIKPQFLVVICIVLIIQRSVKVLIGLLISTIVIIGFSLLMVGVSGMQEILQLWLGYSNGLPTNDPEIMMNWRMVGFNLSPYLEYSIAWGIALIGIVITFIFSLSFWRRPVKSNSTSFVIGLLGTFAATGALAWHSHVASAVILICPLIYLAQKGDILPKNMLPSWVFIPPFIRILVYILLILIQAGILSEGMLSVLYFLTGATGLGLNLYFLFWAVIKFRVRNLSPEAI